MKFNVSIAQLSETKSEDQPAFVKQVQLNKQLVTKELKCLKQHHSEVFSDGASVNDRDEDWDIAFQQLPDKRQKLAEEPMSGYIFKIDDEEEKNIDKETHFVNVLPGQSSNADYKD